MPIARVQHIFKHRSGLSQDDFVNTFYFFTEALTTDAHSEVLVGLVSTFFNKTGPNQADTLVQYIGTAQMLPERETYKVYDVTGAGPHAPIWEGHAPLSQGALPANSETQPIPNEVALCLSYSADPDQGGGVARRRGRVFIGPLNVSCLAQADLGNSRPTANVTDTLLHAGDNLRTNAIAANVSWRMHSPTDNAYKIISHVAVDDAWDTQRRRGMDPTYRNSLPS